MSGKDQSEPPTFILPMPTPKQHAAGRAFINALKQNPSLKPAEAKE